jgi:hypothetical protein
MDSAILLLLNSKVVSVRVGKVLSHFSNSFLFYHKHKAKYTKECAYPPPISRQIGGGLALNLDKVTGTLRQRFKKERERECSRSLSVRLNQLFAD